MDTLINYIKLLEKLLLKLVIENQKKNKQLEQKLQNLIIILSQNGLKPNDIDSCIQENNLNDNIKFSDYDTDNEQNDGDYTEYFSGENLKENILSFFNEQHRKAMKEFSLKISDYNYEELEKNENNYLNKKKERENNIEINGIKNFFNNNKNETNKENLI